MNTTKKIITIGFCILFSNFSFSQGSVDHKDPKQRLRQQKNVISTSPYIFEGVSINQKCYRTKYGVLTCATVQITKILKGNEQITLGTIKVIFPGGSIPEEHIGQKEWVEVSSEADNQSIRANDTCVVFCSIADTSILGDAKSPTKTNLAENTQVLLVGNSINFESKRHNKNPSNIPLAYWWGSNFQSKDELYTYLKDNGGLTVQEEKK
jgi:hypothetical protein